MHFHVVRIFCRGPLVARKKLTGYSLERFNFRVAMEFIINSEVIELI